MFTAILVLMFIGADGAVTFEDLSAGPFSSLENCEAWKADKEAAAANVAEQKGAAGHATKCTGDVAASIDEMKEFLRLGIE